MTNAVPHTMQGNANALTTICLIHFFPERVYLLDTNAKAFSKRTSHASVQATSKVAVDRRCRCVHKNGRTQKGASPRERNITLVPERNNSLQLHLQSRNVLVLDSREVHLQSSTQSGNHVAVLAIKCADASNINDISRANSHERPL